jgi:hypothetical protein
MADHCHIFHLMRFARGQPSQGGKHGTD